MTEAERVELNAEEERFELAVDGATATLAFDEKDGGEVLDLTSTQVPEELQGKGVGGRLVRGTLDWARDHGRRVEPTCPFVETYIEKHPEYRDLVA